MPTPIEALTKLCQKIHQLYIPDNRFGGSIENTNEFKVACAVADGNSMIGKLIRAVGNAERIGHVAEVLEKDLYLCVFGAEKLSLIRSQFDFVEVSGDVRREPVEKAVPMILYCPACGERHIDSNGWETKVHSTHACQSCGFVWRPAVIATVGVQFLPGYKNDG